MQPVKRCKACGSETLIFNSRHNPDGTIRRDRSCKKCGKTFQTIEITTEDFERINHT